MQDKEEDIMVDGVGETVYADQWMTTMDVVLLLLVQVELYSSG